MCARAHGSRSRTFHRVGGQNDDAAGLRPLDDVPHLPPSHKGGEEMELPEISGNFRPLKLISLEKTILT